MELENIFTLPADGTAVFNYLSNPGLCVPCFPGATLSDCDGNLFSGSIRVKLGPITLTYESQGELVELDAKAGRIVINGSGRDKRGNGSFKAVTSLTIFERQRYAEIRSHTDITVTGRPAQFGRGILSDVADKVVKQFQMCVADKLTAAHVAELVNAERMSKTTDGIPAPPTAFISYRRGDTAFQADVIHHILGQEFGRDHVFIDVDSIALGDDFSDTIRRTVASSKFILVLIGDRWLTAQGSRGLRRLDDPSDFVRIEIESALSSGNRVIPVLLDAPMPSPMSLPASIAALARKQAFELRSRGSFEEAKRLLTYLKALDSQLR